MNSRRKGAKAQRSIGRKEQRDNKEKLFARFVLCALCVFATNDHIKSSAAAEGWELGGHIKYQYGYDDYRPDDIHAVLGDDPANDHAADLRLKAENRAGPWDLTAHYEPLAAGGPPAVLGSQGGGRRPGPKGGGAASRSPVRGLRRLRRDAAFRAPGGELGQRARAPPARFPEPVRADRD